MALTVVAFLSCLWAALAASCLTFLIEKFGGRLGGVLASSPSTIVPASIGMALSVVDNDSLLRSLYTVPCGMLVDVLFLLAWREVPPLLAKFPSQLLWLQWVTGCFWDVPDSQELELHHPSGHTVLTRVYVVKGTVEPSAEVSARLSSSHRWHWVSWSDYAELLDSRERMRFRLFLMVIITLCVWAFGSTVTMFILTLMRNAGWPIRLPGLLAAGFVVSLGLGVTFHKQVDAPAGTKQVTWKEHLSRGIVAGTAIFVSVLVSDLNAFLAGIVSTFPAIFTTTMVSLRLAQGEAVQSGAVGPMMLGSTAVIVYSLVFAELFNAFSYISMHLNVRIALSAVLAYLCAVFGASVPTYCTLQYVRTRYEKATGQILSTFVDPSVSDDAKQDKLDQDKLDQDKLDQDKLDQDKLDQYSEIKIHHYLSEKINK